MKKIISLAVAFILVCVLSVTAFAESGFEVRYIQSRLPEISMCVDYDGKDFDVNDVTVNIGGEKVNVNSADKFSAENTQKIYVLMDLSTSMRTNYFNKAKQAVSSLIERADEKTSVTLVTFGDKDPGFYEDEEALEVLPDLKANNEGTKLNEAIEAVIKDSQNLKYGEYDLVYGIVISDGVEYSKGSTTFTEIKNELKKQKITFYGFCTDYSSSEAMNNFRLLISETSGDFYTFNTVNALSSFDDIQKEAQDVYIIKASSLSNVVSSDKLYLKIGESSVSVETSLNSSVDVDNPYVTQCKYDKKENKFILTVSERLVQGSVTTENVYLKTSKDKSILPKSVKYDGNVTLEIFMGKKTSNGDYTICFKNVTDVSDNKNPTENFQLKLTEGYSPVAAWFINYWYIPAIVVAFLILFIVLLAAMKMKNVKTVKELFMVLKDEKIHISNPDNFKIVLHIDNGFGTADPVEVDISKSKIFGRSEYCDVVFDDKKMSRQHFSIGLDEGKICIQDLGTTNGTYINGSRITKMEVLHSGDKIFAGQSTMTVEFQVES